MTLKYIYNNIIRRPQLSRLQNFLIIDLDHRISPL